MWLSLELIDTPPPHYRDCRGPSSGACSPAHMGEFVSESIQRTEATAQSSQAPQPQNLHACELGEGGIVMSGKSPGFDTRHRAVITVLNSPVLLCQGDRLGSHLS